MGRVNNSSEQGAILVEAAISLPVFFLLVMTIIDISKAFSDHLLIGTAHTSVVRDWALRRDSCSFITGGSDQEEKLQNLKDSFAERLAKVGIKGDEISYPDTPVVVSQEVTATVSGETVTLSGLNFRVKVRSRCLMCGIFSAIGAGIDYYSGSFAPYEISCP